MKVHIVCIDDGHIVPRMMRWLTDAHGWTMSERPDPSADANYYGPYTMLAQGLAQTHTVAWFTHDEYWNAGKHVLWQEAARRLDLRLVTSPVYESLEAKGTTARVRPGVDTAHFKPNGQSARKAAIGVAGIGSRRKGLDMVHCLRANGYDVTAAGRGWGIDEHMVDYDDIPRFYRSLDVFICTSTVEGIPAPPLEALACGVKVVVPRNVGAMDLLPEMKGVRHYSAGDYRDLRRAVEMALYDDRRADDLRAVATRFDRAAWCQDHEEALCALL